MSEHIILCFGGKSASRHVLLIASSINNSLVTGAPFVISTNPVLFWYTYKCTRVEDFLSKLSTLSYSPLLWIAVMARTNNLFLTQFLTLKFKIFLLSHLIYKVSSRIGWFESSKNRSFFAFF
jgi:predicted neutral ceramidase superfamily lipid hydrolase